MEAKVPVENGAQVDEKSSVTAPCPGRAPARQNRGLNEVLLFTLTSGRHPLSYLQNAIRKWPGWCRRDGLDSMVSDKPFKARPGGARAL